MTQDQDILARTLYGEARGEYTKPEGGLGALIAVGNVIMNRVKRPDRFENSITRVCQQPYQFSCWNTHDVNYAVITSVSTHNPIFNVCLRVAQHLIQDDWPDLTQGCDHYHAHYVHPYWANGHTPTFKLGHHLFYKL